ncbi:thioredoxin reductase 1, cytoplasmic-like [Saccoglossus kowalevskii]|nr:PREDICTED: thioredoxin reductase 3-like [Saccoglossus kowalevskii]
MAPIDSKRLIQQYIADNKVMIFSKSTCPFCKRVKDLFSSLKVEYTAIELDQIANGKDLQDGLFEMTGQRTVPNVFINSNHIGGCDDTMKKNRDGSLMALVSQSKKQDDASMTESYDYDLIVIGGGSGGLAASKKAAEHGQKVAVFDFVKPTPKGTTWGLGGTCVNVGCIPKKLMHQAALLGHSLEDAKKYGWEFDDKASHNWTTMRDAIQNHIGSLNWGYRVDLRDKNVTYHNAYAEFTDPHTVKAVNKKGKETVMTAKRFIIAVGGRPRYPDIPGAKEYCITSDDLFSLPYNPGKTLVIGASYVALECAGFLAGIGYDTTVMVRSILLRGFDQDMANRIGDYMETHGVKFIKEHIPTMVEQLEEGSPGKLRVSYKATNGGEIKTIECNTVIIAVGRDACTQTIGLDKAGVEYNVKNGKIPAQFEETNVSHIYALGDVLEGKPELTPVAIQAGTLLANRLYGGHVARCDYVNVPTTVFTPLEYGCCGLSEEDAINKYGDQLVEVFHTYFKPLEHTVAQREDNVCYGKIICHRVDSNRVVGFHVLGPNAGEITQGYGVAMKCGLSKGLLDLSIGIHPTCAEIFTTLSVTKGSDKAPLAAGC